MGFVGCGGGKSVVEEALFDLVSSQVSRSDRSWRVFGSKVMLSPGVTVDVEDRVMAMVASS